MILFLQREVKKKNATVLALSSKKFDAMFKTIFDDAESMAWTFSGLFGEAVYYFASFAIKENKVSKVCIFYLFNSVIAHYKID